MVNYNLHEWNFLNGNSHECDYLQGRTILLHLPSFTILEVIQANKINDISDEIPIFQFQITNKFGHLESLQFYVHCTISNDLSRILWGSAIWYSNYLKGEESTELNKEKCKQN
jgi:hypothetical protein